MDQQDIDTVAGNTNMFSSALLDPDSPPPPYEASDGDKDHESDGGADELEDYAFSEGSYEDYGMSDMEDEGESDGHDDGPFQRPRSMRAGRATQAPRDSPRDSPREEDGAMFPPLSPSPVKFSEARRAMRSAPAADQQQEGREDDAHDGGSVANPFALEFERAKTKVLSREVKKLRRAMIDDGNRNHSSPVHTQPSPVQLTPEAEARSRLIVEARTELQAHRRRVGDKVMGASQRLYDWHDPSWIDKKTDIEAALLIERYAQARAAVGGQRNTFEEDFGLAGGLDKRERSQQKSKRARGPSSSLRKTLQREKGWNNSSAYGPLIPNYDATYDQHCTYTTTKAFKASPYMKMVKASTFPKHLKSPLTKKNRAEAALRSQAHAASLQAGAARAAAAEIEAEYTDVYGNFNTDEDESAEIGKAEINLYRTIIIREGLVSRAATLAAQLMSGDRKALGSFNPQLLNPDSQTLNKLLGEEAPDVEPGLLEVLDQLRMATVNTIEAVVRWQTLSAKRRQTSRPGTAATDMTEANEPPTFVWNGRNYVSKIATDIDFLDGLPPLQRALGFPLARNPFVLPGGLDQMPYAPPEIPVVVPTLSAIPSHIIAAASGGKALDSIRLYHAANAVRVEERRGGSVLRQGLHEASGLLPDWNSSNLSQAAIAWPSPPRVKQGPSSQQTADIFAPTLQDSASAVNLLDAEKRLKFGLGLDIYGRQLDTGPLPEDPKAGRDGAPYAMKDRWAGSRERPGASATQALHPSDYAAVKQKTGISRTDLTSLVAYAVPPAGVQLALEALKILLYPHCDRSAKRKKGKGTVPQQSGLQWSALQRMVADRDHLLRCMLQFREAVPFAPEKEAALQKYMDSDLFKEELLVRQSRGAAAICAWVRRVFESAGRAKGQMDHPVLEDEEDMAADAEEDVGLNDNRRRVVRPRSQGTRAGMLALKDEMVKLREMIMSGTMSAAGSPARQREEIAETQPASPQRIPPRRGVEGMTLLRMGFRIPNSRVPQQGEEMGAKEDLGTTYAVLTFVLRQSDQWLMVEAYEPGGAGSTQTQLHPAYCEQLLHMSLQDVAALPAEGREQRLMAIVETMRATHEDKLLRLHFNFPRDRFKGARRVRIRGDSSKAVVMMLNVELLDGSGTPRRRRKDSEDGGLMIIAWHTNKLKHHVLTLGKQELSLLFAHKEHLLRSHGDTDELVRATLDRLWYDGSEDDGHLGIDRAVPLALQASQVTVPHTPLVEGSSTMSRVTLSGSVEIGGAAINLKVQSDAEGVFNIRLLATEMAALSGVQASKTMRLLPAMGRIIDRLYFCTVTEIFKIDKTIMHLETKVSGLKLALVAEVKDEATLFKAMPLDKQDTDENYRVLTKLVTQEDARRLLEVDEDVDVDKLMKPEERASVVERISHCLRLVPLDNDEVSPFTGSMNDLAKQTEQGLDLSSVRLETVLFRRMVHILVSLEGLSDGKDGEDDTVDQGPLPVGSIRIDDSMTLSQARMEIEKQLGGHVTLPESFKFMTRDGRPFTKLEEQRRTVSESLPSLQLRPANLHRRSRRRIPHRLRAMGTLEGISEGDEFYSEDEDYMYSTDGGRLSMAGSVLGPSRGGRASGRTSGKSTSGSGRHQKGGKKKSKLAMKTERKRRERLQGRQTKAKKKKAKKQKAKKRRKTIVVKKTIVDEDGNEVDVEEEVEGTEGEEGESSEMSTTDATESDASTSSKKKKKKGKGKKKKASGKKGGMVRMNASGAAKKKADEKKRQELLAEKEAAAKTEAKAKRRAARPKTPEEPDMQRLPGSVAVEGGSKILKTTEPLAGTFLQRFNRIRIGKAKPDGNEDNLYWLSKDEADPFNETEISLAGPYNDWSNPNNRIYLVLGERGEEKEVEIVVEKEELREDEAKKFSKFFNYKIYWRDVIPMLGEEPTDLHQTKELWYDKVPSAFAAKKTYEYLINLKPSAKELDGSKFSKWVKSLPDVVDGKKIKQTDIDLIFAKSKPASERKLSLENFMQSAICKVAELRYPWLESTGEGLDNPCAREFMKKQVFMWKECADLVWMVSNALIAKRSVLYAWFHLDLL